MRYRLKYRLKTVYVTLHYHTSTDNKKPANLVLVRVHLTLTYCSLYRFGGQGGIRTHDTLARILNFESSAFDLSATYPHATFYV